MRYYPNHGDGCGRLGASRLLIATFQLEEAAMATRLVDKGNKFEADGLGADLGLDASTGSAVDMVSEAIVRGIRAGIFVPGQHLLEPDLTKRLGISRGSLREALKHLSAGGIITLSRFRGAYISTLDRKAVLDLLETLEPLARLAARLAASHCDTKAKRDRMTAATAAIEGASRSRNRAEYLERRRQFYSALVEIGGNGELERAMPLTRTDLFRAQVETVQSEKQRQRHAAGYRRIFEAVVDRDPVRADRAVRQHFSGTRKTMEELPANSFPSIDA
jgi:DNA-binding GntR family transcriptional regulator